MLIRSQDKESLINFSQIIRLIIQGYRVGSSPHEVFEDNINGNVFYIEIQNDTSYHVIGKYTTQEKAMKVLDMIQSAYESSLYSDGGYDNSAQIMRPYIFARNTVFQMPQDSEVDV